MSTQIGFVLSAGGLSGGGWRRRKIACAGFTLVELMTVLIILAILATIGIPMFSDATLGSRLGSYANDLVSSAYLARSEAMKRNVVVTLCASANGTDCASSGDWEQGWIVWDEDSEEVFLHHQALAEGFRLTGTGGLELTFQPTGIGSTQSTFTLCRATPQAGKQERVVTVSATGRPSVSRTETGTCS